MTTEKKPEGNREQEIIDGLIENSDLNGREDALEVLKSLQLVFRGHLTSGGDLADRIENAQGSTIKLREDSVRSKQMAGSEEYAIQEEFASKYKQAEVDLLTAYKSWADQGHPEQGREVVTQGINKTLQMAQDNTRLKAVGTENMHRLYTETLQAKMQETLGEKYTKEEIALAAHTIVSFTVDKGGTYAEEGKNKGGSDYVKTQEAADKFADYVVGNIQESTFDYGKLDAEELEKDPDVVAAYGKQTESEQKTFNLVLQGMGAKVMEASVEGQAKAYINTPSFSSSSYTFFEQGALNAFVKNAGRKEGQQVDLSGVDFSGMTVLADTSALAGANLSGTNFSNTNLSNINLSNADLTGANFDGADLTGADLTGATGLTAAQFSKVKGLASVQGIDALRDQVLDIQRQELKEALGKERTNILSIAGKLEKNPETEGLAGLLMDNQNAFKKLDPETMTGEELGNVRMAVAHNHKVVTGANNLLGNDAAVLQSLPATIAGLTPQGYEKDPDTKALEQDTKVVGVFLNPEETLDAYRGAVKFNERQEHKALLQGYLDAGGALPEDYKTLEMYIRADDESHVNRLVKEQAPSKHEDIVAFADKVQSGEIKTVQSRDDGLSLNFANKLSVDVFYPEDDGRKKDEIKATESFLKQSAFSEKDVSVVSTYIAENHPALLAPLSTDQEKILRVDYPAIHVRGSVFASRNPQFFDKWKEGIELIDETQEAVKSALETSGGKLTPEVVKTLAEYDSKALGHLKEQVQMTPGNFLHESEKKLEMKEVFFGKGATKKPKAEALKIVQEKIDKADAIAADPGKQLEQGGAVEMAQTKATILKANEDWITKKASLKEKQPEQEAPEKKRGFFSKVKDAFKGYVISGPFNVKREGGVDIKATDVPEYAARAGIEPNAIPLKGTAHTIDAKLKAKNDATDVAKLKEEHQEKWDGVNQRTKEGKALREAVDKGRMPPEKAKGIFAALKGLVGFHSKRGMPAVEEVQKGEGVHAAASHAEGTKQHGRSEVSK